MSRLAIADHFEWPEMAALEESEYECDMHGFVSWLVEIGEITELSRRRLEILHMEFCSIAGVRPLTPRKQSQIWPSVGLIKARPSVYVPQEKGRAKETRRTVYSVSPLVLFQMDMQERRAA